MVSRPETPATMVSRDLRRRLDGAQTPAALDKARAELAEWLLERPTCPDAAWRSYAAGAIRRKSESREDFIRRALM